MSSKRTPTVAPQIDQLHLGDLSDGDPTELMPRAELSALKYTDLTLTQLDLTGASLDGVHFDGLQSERATLTGSVFSEVAFDHVDIPVVSASRSRFVDMTFNGRIGSLDASDAYLRSVHFVGCKLSFVNLHGAELLDVTFTDCHIDDLDLVSSKIRRVKLKNTRVGSLSVQHSSLTDFDLREADLNAVAGLEHLRGATISTHQLNLLAPLMALHFGIKVED